MASSAIPRCVQGPEKVSRPSISTSLSTNAAESCSRYVLCAESPARAVPGARKILALKLLAAINIV